MKRSARLATRAQSIRDFREAYERLLAGASNDKEVAELAGPAASAVDETVGGVMLPVRLGQHVVNPVSNWRVAWRQSGPFSPQDVLDSCDQAIGSLDTEMKEARALESSVAGRIARFVRIPWSIKEAMDLPENRAAERAAMGAGFLFQIVVGVLVILIAGAVSGAISALIRWLI